jgi:hypothetical protein
MGLNNPLVTQGLLEFGDNFQDRHDIGRTSVQAVHSFVGISMMMDLFFRI